VHVSKVSESLNITFMLDMSLYVGDKMLNQSCFMTSVVYVGQIISEANVVKSKAKHPLDRGWLSFEA